MPEDEINKTYACVSRSLVDEVLEGRLTRNEFNALVWLILRANYLNGVRSVGYAGLAEELQIKAKDKTNAATKLLSALKGKGHLSYEKHQGKGGSFRVVINNYLTPKALKALWGKRKESLGTSTGTSLAEVSGTQQKSVSDSEPISNVFSDEETSIGRSANNENENKKDIKSNSIPLKEENWGNSGYESDSEYAEQRKRKIAFELGETDLRFINWAYQNYGLDVIEEAYQATLAADSKREIKDVRKYFNFLVRKYGEDGRSK